MSVVAYCRVSTNEQADKGHSLALQEKQCLAYCALYGLTVTEVVRDEGASAKTLKRPGWARVEELLGSGEVDGVVVMKLDRLTRNLRDFLYLCDNYFFKAVNLHAVQEKVDTSTPNGRLVLNILMSVAQWEREEIADRTRKVAQAHKQAGKRWGQIPYGQQLASDGTALEPNQEESENISKIMNWRKTMSIRQVVDKLNKEGIPPRGSVWHYTTVRRILAVA